MSMSYVPTIIIRAVLEHDFCDLFFRDIDSALKGHDLTEMEIEWLRRLSRKEFEGFAPELEKGLTQRGKQIASPSLI